MTRVKRGVTSCKKRKNVLRQTKGYKWAGKSKERTARERLLHAGLHAFNDRRKKKRVMRRLHQIQLGAASRAEGLSYSRMIDGLKKAEIQLDRKILAQLAQKHPETFRLVVKQANQK